MLAFGCAQAGLAISFAPAVNRVLRGCGGPASAVASQHQRDGPVPVAHDSRGDRGDHRLSGWAVAATGRGRRGVVARPAGMGGDSQRGDRGRAGTAVVGPEVLRRAASGSSLCPRAAGPNPCCWPGPRWRRTGFAFLAAEGFAPDGHFPWLTAVIFAAGVLLVAMRPRDRGRAEAIGCSSSVWRLPHAREADAKRVRTLRSARPALRRNSAPARSRAPVPRRRRCRRRRSPRRHGQAGRRRGRRRW